MPLINRGSIIIVFKAKSYFKTYVEGVYMSSATLDVVGIGNAIVDVISSQSDDFLQAQDLPKGMMTLIDANRAQTLYETMGSNLKVSGGSAANTLAGIACLGGKGAYIGKVGNDSLGDAFRKDILAVGVDYHTPPLIDGGTTARCLIIVTPDAQRTMSTYLGASVSLGPKDIDVQLIGSSKITYLEGYLFDPPEAKKAFKYAAEVSHKAGRMVSLSLSDGFCVDRHRMEFLKFVRDHVDILFANEVEIKSLFEVDNFESALQKLRGKCKIAALTRGEAGAVILTDSDTIPVGVVPVEHIIDTTGAGDLFAAGFLFGITHNYSLENCGRLGAMCAAEIISHYGARPEVSLKELLFKKGFK